MAKVVSFRPKRVVAGKGRVKPVIEPKTYDRFHRRLVASFRRAADLEGRLTGTESVERRRRAVNSLHSELERIWEMKHPKARSPILEEGRAAEMKREIRLLTMNPHTLGWILDNLKIEPEKRVRIISLYTGAVEHHEKQIDANTQIPGKVGLRGIIRGILPVRRGAQPARARRAA